MRSQSPMTTRMLCSISTTVIAARADRTDELGERVAPRRGSSPAAGSSSNTTRGCPIEHPRQLEALLLAERQMRRRSAPSIAGQAA